MEQKFYRKILKNGMTVLLEKRNLPVVSAAFAVRNGGVNEAEFEKGISHFIEHMLFKGTSKRTSRQIAGEIEKKGGELNGFTSEEITAYFCKISSKYLGIALDVLSDLVKNPLFDEEEFEKERKVIFEEIKMGHDNPRLHVFDEVQKLLYNGTMGIGLTGTIKTMNNITKNKLAEKFRQTYTSNNIILCVVGNANFESLVKFAKESFGEEKSKVPFFKFAERNNSKKEFRKGIDQANLVFAYHVPKANSEKHYAAEVLSALMAEGMSSRLFSEIREKRNLAYSVKGEANINKSFAYNFIYVGTSKENVDKVKKLILEEFRKVSKFLPNSELSQIKEQLIGKYKLGMEDSQSQMINLLSNEICGNAKDFYKFERGVSKVKIKDVKLLARKASKKFSFFALIPKD